MFFQFTASKHVYRVKVDGRTKRAAVGGDVAKATSLALTPAEFRIMSVLVRTKAPVSVEEIAQRCLHSEEEESVEPIEQVHRHMKGLSKALGCPEILERDGSAYRLGARVRRVSETNDWHLLQSIPEDEHPDLFVKPVLVRADWISPEAAQSGAAMEIHEITATRPDGKMRLLGYASGEFKTDSLPHFVLGFEPSASSLFQWACPENPSNLVAERVDDTGALMYVEKGDKTCLRMVVGPSGAKARMAWTPDTGSGIPRTASNSTRQPITFTCGDATFSTFDGRQVQKQIPGRRTETLKLGKTAARMLMAFLTRSQLGPLSHDDLCQAVWPERSPAGCSPSLIRRTLHRVRSVFKPEDIILAVGPPGMYALNAHLGLWFSDTNEAGPTMPAGLEQVPLRIILPRDYTVCGPATGDTLEMQEVRAGRPGQSMMLGIAADTGLTNVNTLLDPGSRHGRFVLEWSDLDSDQPVDFDHFYAPNLRFPGPHWRVGDDGNHIFVFANSTLRFEWTSPRVGAPGSALAAIQENERRRLASQAEELDAFAADLLNDPERPDDGGRAAIRTPGVTIPVLRLGWGE